MGASFVKNGGRETLIVGTGECYLQGDRDLCGQYFPTGPINNGNNNHLLFVLEEHDMCQVCFLTVRPVPPSSPINLRSLFVFSFPVVRFT
jgi:hypothetical protein